MADDGGHTFCIRACIDTYIVLAYTRAAKIVRSICLTDSSSDDLPAKTFYHGTRARNSTSPRKSCQTPIRKVDSLPTTIFVSGESVREIIRWNLKVYPKSFDLKGFIHFIHFIVETSRPPSTLRCRGNENLWRILLCHMLFSGRMPCVELQQVLF